jgi:hypothetical protein
MGLYIGSHGVSPGAKYGERIVLKLVHATANLTDVLTVSLKQIAFVYTPNHYHY